MKSTRYFNKTSLLLVAIFSLLFFSLPTQVSAQGTFLEQISSGIDSIETTINNASAQCANQAEIAFQQCGSAVEDLPEDEQVNALTRCENDRARALASCGVSQEPVFSSPQSASAFPDISDLNQISGIQGENGSEKVSVLIGRAIRFALGIFGSIAMAVLVLAGITWMLAMGNAGREEKAKDIMLYGALGVFVVLGAYTIVTFIYQAIGLPI